VICLTKSKIIDMKKLLIVTLLSFLVNAIGHSQSLSVDSISAEANIPDTVNYNANLNHTFPVNISGGTPFTGTVWLIAGVDSSSGVISLDTIGFRNVVNKQNDTIMFTINETYNNANAYRFGGNVVVIWPVATGLNTLDTFQTNVFIIQAVGINNVQHLYNAISVYPNPTKDYIYINKKDQKIDVKHVRIYNLKGQLIYDEKFRSKIDVSRLSEGLYFLKLETDEGEVLNYKLIKK
jgi:hypothetical protein